MRILKGREGEKEKEGKREIERELMKLDYNYKLQNMRLNIVSRNLHHYTHLLNYSVVTAART